MHIISNVALISINETLILQVISFLIFLFIINRIMFRPLRNMMSERKKYIHRIQKDFTAAEGRFESVTNQIKQQEKAVRKEAFEQKENLEASGGRQAAAILASAREEMNALRAEAHKDIDARISAARKDVQKESEDLAKNIIGTLLDRNLQS